MSCYFVAQIQITNMEEYENYLKGVDEVFAKYNGKYLAVDKSPQILEGSWDYSRIVIIEFENERELRRWYESPEYQAILKHRLKSAKCDTIVVKGCE